MNSGLCAAITGLACVQVDAAVEAAQQDGVHFGEQCGDVGHDLHAVLRVHVLGELIDAADAVRDVFAAALVGRHNARAGDVVGRGRVAIQQFGEGGDVRRVGPDHADTDIRGERAEREGEERESCFHAGIVHRRNVIVAD